MNAPVTEAKDSEHSALGGSVIALVEICPGSYRLSKGMPNTAGHFAREGSLAHELAAHCLDTGLNPKRFEGKTLPGYEDMPINKEMVLYIGEYVAYCRAQCEPGDVVLIEASFNLDELVDDAPESLFGSADFTRYRPRTCHLLTLDLKYGSGVAVEVRTESGQPNRQTLYYATGATLELKKRGYKVKSASVGIYQPRALHPHGPVRMADVSALDLLDWMGDLAVIVREAGRPDAPLVAGHHCRTKFCKALPRCKAHQAWLMTQAQLEFSDGLLQPVFDAPELLSHDDITAILDAAPALVAWVKACQDYVHRTLERGDPFEHWKLVDKRATRSWDGDQNEIADELVKLGADPSAIWERSLLSPAQAEKLLEKDRRPGLAKLTKKVSSGTTLARDTDSRPGVASGPAAEFTPI